MRKEIEPSFLRDIDLKYLLRCLPHKELKTLKTSPEITMWYYLHELSPRQKEESKEILYKKLIQNIGGTFMEQKFWNKPSCLSMTEVEKILKSEEGLSVCNRAVISLLCEISLRNSEICSLKVEDISFQNKNIMVCCKKTTPKTLTLSEGCLLLLKEYIEQHPTKRGTLFVSNKESNFQ